MSRPFVVFGVDEHGERLTNPNRRRHRRRIRKLPHLQVHPALHRAVTRKPHLLVVQHLHLEGLELDPLLGDEGARPLTVDLPGRVPDLLDVGVHLDDDDVGDDGGHLARRRGGGDAGEQGGEKAVLRGVGYSGERGSAVGERDGEGGAGQILAWVQVSAGGRWQGQGKKEGGCVQCV